ncbi:hypothetical protein HY345_02725 [Candidatus Microgenomates bacterium]|nr:hypothetical protein [Candidatus Microgenomates bacterium]
MAERNLGSRSRKAVTVGEQGKADQAMLERRFKVQHILSVVTGRGVRDEFKLTPITDPRAARMGHADEPFIVGDKLTVGIQDHGTETVNYDAKTLADWYV